MRKDLKQWIDDAAKISAGTMPILVHLSGQEELKFAENYVKKKAKFKQISFKIPDNFAEDADDDLL